jgi:hypothetical protein
MFLSPLSFNEAVVVGLFLGAKKRPYTDHRINAMNITPMPMRIFLFMITGFVCALYNTLGTANTSGVDGQVTFAKRVNGSSLVTVNLNGVSPHG